jgi:3-hydroxybutyrate dehydrogenase
MSDQEVGQMVSKAVGEGVIVGTVQPSGGFSIDPTALPVVNGSLLGRIALVTGAGGGIGAAICTEFEELGASVFRVDREGSDCHTYDLSSEDASRAMVEDVMASAGRLDIVVLNAGLQYMAPIDEFPTPKWDELFDVMVKSAFVVIREAWPALSASPAGRIVAVGSRASFLGAPHKAAYVAAKHALLGLVRVAAIEGASVDITANLLAPGWVDTALLRGQVPDQARLLGVSEREAIDVMLAQAPRNRFLAPREVARVASYLASDAASVLNGVVIEVN